MKFILKLINLSTESSNSEGGDWSKKRFEFHFEFPPKFDSKKFDDRWSSLASLALALGAGYLLTRPRENVRHISWQEFRMNYLEKGEVERLEVINGTLVKAYLHRDGAGSLGVSHMITT